MEWQVQKMCTDIGEYELTVEKEKNSWECDQKRKSWKWSVAYHGSIVARGSNNTPEQAKAMAIGNVPESAEDNGDDCSTC